MEIKIEPIEWAREETIMDRANRRRPTAWLITLGGTTVVMTDFDQLAAWLRRKLVG